MKFLACALSFIFLPVTLHAPSLISHAVAEECSGDTCIDVSADDNKEIVIKIRKGSPGSTSTSRPRPRATTSTRKTWIPWLPKPRPTATSHTSRPRSSPRPSRAPRVKTISATALADQVRSLIPSGTILTQPATNGLVHEPMNFMTTVPTTFRTVIVLLGVPITLNLRANYSWDFGDGENLTTNNPGAPYPISPITHTYRESGYREVLLTVHWSGTWSAGPMVAPIRGVITQRFSRMLQIHPAATRLTR